MTLEHTERPAARPGDAHERTRTYSWADAGLVPAAMATTSGIDLLRALRDREFPPPPVMDTIDAQLLEVDEGRVVFGMTPQEFHYNPLGSVHGGMIATILDSALGCAVHSRLPAGVGYTSLEIKVNYVRGITVATGPIRCEGVVLSLGRRSATAEAKVTDANGKLMAHGTTTCLIFPLPT